MSRVAGDYTVFLYAELFAASALYLSTLCHGWFHWGGRSTNATEVRKKREMLAYCPPICLRFEEEWRNLPKTWVENTSVVLVDVWTSEIAHIGNVLFIRWFEDILRGIEFNLVYLSENMFLVIAEAIHYPTTNHNYVIKLEKTQTLIDYCLFVDHIP